MPSCQRPSTAGHPAAAGIEHRRLRLRLRELILDSGKIAVDENQLTLRYKQAGSRKKYHAVLKEEKDEKKKP